MHEKLKKYFDDEREHEKRVRDLFLIRLNLYEKVYSEEKNSSKEFPFCEKNPETGELKYYKKQPIEITDEEYKKLKEIDNRKNPPRKPPENSMANILSGIATTIYIIAFILGFALGFITMNGEGFSLIIAIAYWGIGFLSGTSFLGFAEIIKLLNDIKNK